MGNIKWQGKDAVQQVIARCEDIAREFGQTAQAFGYAVHGSGDRHGSHEWTWVKEPATTSRVARFVTLAVTVQQGSRDNPPLGLEVRMEAEQDPPGGRRAVSTVSVRQTIEALTTPAASDFHRFAGRVKGALNKALMAAEAIKEQDLVSAA